MFRTDGLLDSAAMEGREWRALAALCDVLLQPDPSAWRTAVAPRAAAVLESLPDRADLAQARLFLRLLDMRAAAFVLGREWGPFSALDRERAERFLGRLAAHPVASLRGALQAMKRLVTVTYYADVDDAGRNPTWARIGYPGPVAPARADGPKPIRPLRIERDTTLDCDVVVVGSGAGGGVVASELAAAGQDVLVLERGGYHDDADFDQLEVPSLRRLYLDGGLAATTDQGVIVLAGSCLGGGTVVNYTTSLALPPSVREQWDRESGLDLFSSDGFARSVDAVLRRLDVNGDHGRASARERLMERGLAELGWSAKAMTRNVRGCTQDDSCGYCGFGCVRGAKRSMTKTYLQDAFDHRARIVVDCEVERVTVRDGAAVGVVGRTREGAVVEVRARAVVAAAGAIGTPALLLRSGLGGRVGHGLRLHPTTAVWGTFDEEVRPWTGTIQARYSDEFADLDDGYGFMLETTGVHPAFFALATPWRDAAQFDSVMRELPHVSLVGVLVRDRDGGRVTVSRAGRPRIAYAVSPYDQRHVRRGVEAGARVLAAAGARRIWSMQARYLPLDPRSEAIERWMSRVDAVGYGPNRTLYATFHQMGTCRMGADRRSTVTKPTGETYAVRGLYVADASLFPASSGVNPMITVAALGHHVAQAMKERL